MDSDWGYEVAVVGSGLAGLVCARHLQRQGIKTVIVEKSRGLGGRMATRRRDRVCFDHGLPGISLSQPQSQPLLQELLTQGIVQPGLITWAQGQPNPTLSALSPVKIYVAPEGMTAIAKYLAQDLDIKREWRLQTLIPADNGYWQLVNAPGETLLAKAVVMTVPAPQALAILTRSRLENFSRDLTSQLQSIIYDPSLVVMAGYSLELAPELDFPWQVLEFPQDSTLNKIILDSRKRSASNDLVYILHSTPDFARQFDARQFDLATDLSDAAQVMLQKAADRLHPALTQPEWHQVHRWRYALPQSPIASAFLEVQQPLPLFFCGDGYGACQDSTLLSSLQPAERAIISGFAAANALLTTVRF